MTGSDRPRHDATPCSPSSATIRATWSSSRPTAKPGDFGGFAPMVFEHAAKGDTVAERILDKAIADVEASLDVLDLGGDDPLCLLGGLAPLYAPRLSARYRALLKPPLQDALGGAVQMAVRLFASARRRRRWLTPPNTSSPRCKDSAQKRRAALSAAQEEHRGRGQSRHDRPRRRAALRARHRGQGRHVARHRAQGGAGSGARAASSSSGMAPAPSSRRASKRVEQSLSRLTSFTEDMARRGMAVRSDWLDRGLYPPSPDEMMVLGLSSKRTGGAGQPAAHRQRHAAGHRARLAVGRACCPTRKRSARRSMRRSERPATGPCAPCSAYRPPISARPTRSAARSAGQARPASTSNAFPISPAAR